MPDINLTFNPVVGNYVAPANLETVAASYSILEQGHQAAINAKTQISTKLAELPLNAAEEGWRQEQLNRLENTLRSNTVYGNAYSAYDDVMRTADAIVTSPEMRSKIRSQSQYKTFIDSVNNSNLSEDKKEYFREVNKYYDAGITNDWKPKDQLVDEINIYSLLTTAYANVAKDKGGSNVIYYRDKNGNFTPDYSQSDDGMPYMNIAGKYERIKESDIRAAVQAAIANTPGAQASIDQDYKIAVWKHQRNGGKGVSEVTDAKGIILNEDQYLEKRLRPFYQSATYNHYFETVSPLTGMSINAFKARAKAAESGAGTSLADVIANAKVTVPGVYNLQRQSALEANVANRNNSARRIVELANQLGMQADVRDVDGLYNRITNYYRQRGQTVPKEIKDAHYNWQKAQDDYANIMNKIPEQDRAKVDFISTVDTGTDTGITYNNDYITEFNQLKADIVNGYSDIKLAVNGNINDALAKLKDFGYNFSYGNNGNTNYIIVPKENVDDIVNICNTLGNSYGSFIPYGTMTGARGTVGYNDVNYSEMFSRNPDYKQEEAIGKALRYYKDVSNSISQILTAPVAIPSEVVYEDDVTTTLATNLQSDASGKWSDYNAAVKQAKSIIDGSIGHLHGAQVQDMTLSVNGLTGSFVDNTAAKEALIRLMKDVRNNSQNGSVDVGYDKNSLATIVDISLTGRKTSDPSIAESLSILSDAGIDIANTDHLTISFQSAFNNKHKTALMNNPSFRLSNEFYTKINGGIDHFNLLDNTMELDYDGQNYYLSDVNDGSVYITDYNGARSKYVGDSMYREIKNQYDDLVIQYGDNIPQSVLNGFEYSIFEVVKNFIPGNEFAETTNDLNAAGKRKYNDIIYSIMENQ